MEHRRPATFLATKSRERSREAALRDREPSLKLMKTDHLDLSLLHNIEVTKEVNAVFAKGGAMEAFTQMRGTRAFSPQRRRSLSHHSFSKRLLTVAVEKQRGIIGMKIAAHGRILSSWTPPAVEV